MTEISYIKQLNTNLAPPNTPRACRRRAPGPPPPTSHIRTTTRRRDDHPPRHQGRRLRRDAPAQRPPRRRRRSRRARAPDRRGGARHAPEGDGTDARGARRRVQGRARGPPQQVDRAAAGHHQRMGRRGVRPKGEAMREELEDWFLRRRGASTRRTSRSSSSRSWGTTSACSARTVRRGRWRTSRA